VQQRSGLSMGVAMAGEGRVCGRAVVGAGAEGGINLSGETRLRASASARSISIATRRDSGAEKARGGGRRKR